MTVVLITVLLIIVILSLVGWGSRMSQIRQNYLHNLMDEVAPSSEKPVFISPSNFPNPLQRYLEYCFGHKAPEFIRMVRLTQEGDFKLRPNKENNKGWLPITAEQFVNTVKSDFFWFARIKVKSILWIQEWDYCFKNQANMHWKLNSLFKILDDKARN